MDLSPEALGMDLAEEKAPAQPSVVPDLSPEALGMDLSPEALGMDVEAPKEAYEQSFTPFVKDQAKLIGDYWGKKIPEVTEKIGEQYDKIPSPIKTSLEVAAIPAKSAFSVLNKAIDVSSRVAGTTIAGATYYSKYLGFDPLDSERIRKEADEADIRQGLNIDSKTGEAKPRFFNVSLGTDLIQKPMQRDLVKYGQNLQKLENPVARLGGDVLEGSAPAIAMVGGIVGEAYLNPLSLVRVGTLSKAGVALEKEGKLAGNVAQQMAKGERNLISLKLGDRAGKGGLGVDIESRTIAPQAISKVQEGLVKLEQTRAGQAARYLTTASGWGTVDNALPDAVIAKKLSTQRTKNVMTKADTILKTNKIDVNNPNTMKALYAYLDQPSIHVSDDIIPRHVVKAISQTLDDELAFAYKAAEGVGVPTPQFKPGSGFRDSERYVPRGSFISKSQELRLQEKFGDLLKLEKYGDEARALGGGASGGSKVDVGFLQQRSKLTREALNDEIKKKFGIEDYFHSDPVLAYGEKIDEVYNATIQKKFLDDISNKFPESDVDWLLAKKAANEKIKFMRAKGEIPPTDLLRTANVRIGGTNIRLGDINIKTNEGVRRLSPKAVDAIRKLNPDGEFQITKALVPGPVADLIESTFVRPDVGLVGATAQTFVKLFKTNVFFQPGFHLRNWWESFGRAHSADVKVSEIYKGMKDLGILSKSKNMSAAEKSILNEWRAVGPVKGITSDVKVAGVNIGSEDAYTKLIKMRENVKIEVSKEMMKSENPLNRFVNGLRHQGATGSFKTLWGKKKEFLSPTDNPLYNFSRTVNESGEEVFRYTYYKKLRLEGYDQASALKKIDNTFMNYDIVRSKAMSPMGQVVAPFMNYAVKNAETLGAMLLQKPASYGTFGPGGYLERAITQWGNLDPDIVPKLKENMPGYLADHVLAPFLPGSEAVLEEKDYVKQLLNWSFGGKEGMDLLVRLPSNYHGLRMLDPTQLEDMSGPLIRAGIAFLGVDPFTGKPIPLATDPDEGAANRTEAMLGELGNAINPIPYNVIGAGQAMIEKQFPKWEENFINLGFEPRVAEFFFGKKNLETHQKRMQKRLVKIKSFYLGTATHMGADFQVRMMVNAKQLRDKVSAWKYEREKDRMSQGELERRIEEALKVYEKRVDDLDKSATELDLRYDMAAGNQKMPQLIDADLSGVSRDVKDDFDDNDPAEDAMDDALGTDLIDGTIPTTGE